MALPFSLKHLGLRQEITSDTQRAPTYREGGRPLPQQWEWRTASRQALGHHFVTREHADIPSVSLACSRLVSQLACHERFRKNVGSRRILGLRTITENVTSYARRNAGALGFRVRGRRRPLRFNGGALTGTMDQEPSPGPGNDDLHALARAFARHSPFRLP